MNNIKNIIVLHLNKDTCKMAELIFRTEDSLVQYFDNTSLFNDLKRTIDLYSNFEIEDYFENKDHTIKIIYN